jgi:CheY-like chemotaxis protein
MTTAAQILLLDDDEVILELTASMLEILGYSCSPFSCPKQALSRLGQQPPVALIMTDHKMPTMTGRHFAEQAKHLAPQTPVVLCTGGDLNGLLQDNLFSGILKKPYSLEDLSSMVQNHLG